MKTYLSTFVILLSLLIFSCEKEEPGDARASEVNLNKSSIAFMNAMENRSENISDPFALNSILIENNQVKINVSYSGGCKTHKFSIIWDGTINTSFPPSINLLIIHDANNDNCEAYITETIVFELNELADSSFEEMPGSVGAFNGWNQKLEDRSQKTEVRSQKSEGHNKAILTSDPIAIGF